jgi:hypothetical protein
MQQPNDNNTPNLLHELSSTPTPKKPNSTDTARSPSPDEEHRRLFVKACFGTSPPSSNPETTTIKSHAILTKENYDEHMRILRYWNLPSGHIDETNGRFITTQQFRNSVSRAWYNNVKSLRIQRLDNGTEVMEKLDEKTNIWKRMLHTDNVFDAIKECHGSDHHIGIKATKNEVNTKYWNVAEQLCRMFVHTCPKCKESMTKKKTPQATRRLSANEYLTDKYIVSIFDFSQKPQKDWNGNTMSYVLMVYDSAADWMVLNAMQTLETNAVKYDILHIMCTRGHPRVKGIDIEASKSY